MRTWTYDDESGNLTVDVEFPGEEVGTIEIRFDQIDLHSRDDLAHILVELSAQLLTAACSALEL